jgi:putative ABC transport system permease protein
VVVGIAHSTSLLLAHKHSRTVGFYSSTQPTFTLAPSRMFQRLPVAWLQLKHQKIRLIVALSGVIFAVVIVFMQFGIRDALFDSAVRFHKSLNADCVLISPRSTSLIAMDAFSERRLGQTLAFPEVDFVAPIYLGFAQWKNPQTRNYWRNILVIGFDTRYPAFTSPEINEKIPELNLSNRILFDRKSRKEFGPIVSEFQKHNEVVAEIGSRGLNTKVHVVGLFGLGTSFGSDGNILTSHLNFLRIVNARGKGFVHVGLIKLKPGSDVDSFTSKLRKYLPNDVRVLSKTEYIKFDKDYWQSSTAIGFIFSLGVLLGIIVGIVVVYQILYTNVSEHLPEYATLKALGYRHRYLLSVVFQQAFFIAVMGYFPGFVISLIQYEITKQATLLPIAMTLERAIYVFASTLAMCLISGATAVRKLQDADPADIF